MKEHIMALLEEGRTSENVASLLGCSGQYVRKVAGQNGLSLEGRLRDASAELKVKLAALAGTESDRKIAARLGTSPRTVRRYRHANGIKSWGGNTEGGDNG